MINILWLIKIIYLNFEKNCNPETNVKIDDNIVGFQGTHGNKFRIIYKKIRGGVSMWHSVLQRVDIFIFIFP